MGTQEFSHPNLTDNPAVAEGVDRPQSSIGHVDSHGYERLFKKFDANLGLSILTNREQLAVFQSVTTGLKHLSRLQYQGNAHDWAQTFEGFGDLIQKELGTVWPNPKSAARHPLLQVLINQPAPNRTQEQRKSCLAIGALAFITIGFGIGRIGSDFSSQLKQLFRSNHESWLELSRVDVLEIDSLKEWVPKTQAAVVHEFRYRLIDLHRLAIPSLSSFISPAAVTETSQPLMTRLRPRHQRHRANQNLGKIRSKTSVRG